MNHSQYCLVTGASGGIGSAIARALSEAGYLVILQGRNKDKLIKLQHSLTNKTFVITGDLSQLDDRERILNQAFRIGHIDLLVNSAGTSHFSSFADTTPETIAQLIDINLTAPILFSQGFIARAQQSNNLLLTPIKTTLVNVGSAFGFIGYPGFSPYCASKFGLRGFTESLARELSDSDIKLAYFAPRATQTDINSSVVNELNSVLGNNVDSTEFVAKEFMSLLKHQQTTKVVGWPEKLFAKINGVLPRLVDRAINAKLPLIKPFLSRSPQTVNLTTHTEEMNHEKV